MKKKISQWEQVTIQSREIKSDFVSQNCSELLVFKHRKENELIRYRCGFMQNETGKPSHPIWQDNWPHGCWRWHYGKDFKVNKPLDIEIIWELCYLQHIWKISLNLTSCEVLWDAAGVKYFRQCLGYWNNV